MAKRQSYKSANAANKAALERKRKTTKTPEVVTAPVMYGAVNLHDHAGGWIACAACQAEHIAERVGGLAWSTFIYDVMTVLGAHKPSKTDEALNLRRAQALGVDLDDAKEYWVRNFSGAAYVELRPQLKLPPSERVRPRSHRNDIVPDVLVAKLRTLEVATRIEYWLNAATTGQLDGKTVSDVGALVREIHAECEAWIKDLED